MKDGSQSRHKKLEKISFEEVMGAAGMSGFGALLERRPGIEEPGWKPAAESRLKFLLKGAALAEKLGRQNDMLRSLNEPLTRRVTSLAQALGILKHRLSANDSEKGLCDRSAQEAHRLVSTCEIARGRVEGC